MKRTVKSWLIVASTSIFLLASCSKLDFFKKETDTLPNDVIIQWNLVALQAEGGTGYMHALLSSRVDAMVHLAMHDALNAIDPIYEQYAYKTHGRHHADPHAAAAMAAYTVLLGSFPETKSMLDSALAASLSTVPDGFLKDQGLMVGMKAGNAMLDLRAGDGAFDNPVVYITPSTEPGVYNVVPPFDFLFGPQWKTMKLFSLQTHDQFRSVPPPALTSETYTKDFIEVKEFGSVNSTARTAEQGAYAKWWYEYVEIGWNRVARIMSRDHQSGLYKTARLFALMNMAIMDSYIAGWDSKNYYNFWRPYTAIRAASTDGNDKTIEDLTWESVEPTPPVQDYPSTHTTGANAAATVLAHFFGDHTGFAMTSSTGMPANSVRSFQSFKQAANENAESRVMAGIHFRFATLAGQKMGDQIGNWTLKNHLQRIR